MKELTFKPNIITRIQNPVEEKENIPHFDKSIFRMHEARRIRSESNQSKQRNKMNSQNVSPFLYLNVTM
jgi:hypothetical protein